MKRVGTIAGFLLIIASIVLAGCGSGRGIIVDVPGLDINVDLPEVDIEVDVPEIAAEIILPERDFSCRMPVEGFGINLVNAIEGSGSVVLESRSVQEYDRISFNGCGEVILTQGDEESLSIEVDDNLLPYIKSEVQSGELILGFTEQLKHKTIAPSEGIKFFLSFKELDEIGINGAGVIRADSLKADRLAIYLRGAGDVTIDGLTADRLLVQIPGAGKVEVSGRVEEQEILLSGLGSYKGEDLESEIAQVELRGLGDANLWVSSSLDVVISGAGSVSYYGNPAVAPEVSGLGRLSHLGDR